MNEYEYIEDAVKLLRKQKHDFLNYLQVIQGYLQLSKIPEAKANIKKAIEEIQEKGALLRIECSLLALNLLKLIDEAFKLGVPLTIRCTTHLAKYKNDDRILAELVGNIWTTCIASILRAEEKDRYFNFSIDEKALFTFSGSNLAAYITEEDLQEFNIIANKIALEVVWMDEKLIIKEI
jgi:sensor histidine kinase regulating citrate/malate metabolism